MSTFKIEIVRIDSVMNHPGADRLDLIRIKDWQCVSAKGNFKQGDLAIYFPIDSILPAEVETKIFGIDSKVKLTNSRVKTIKLRGAISQGLAVKPETLDCQDFEEGDDLTGLLKVTKYEVVDKSCSLRGNPTSKKKTNPHFKKYTGIENAKNYNTIFQEGDEVFVTEKIHGTNFRCGYVPFYADTLFKKIKQFFGLAPKKEFVYGSHNVQLQSKFSYTGYYDKNVYAEAVFVNDLKNLPDNTVIYGEIYGCGIQKGYAYGCTNDGRSLVVFDVMVDGKYLDAIAAKKFCEERDLDTPPVLYTGPFKKEKILALRDGPSVLAPEQKTREGIVVKSIKEENCMIGRKMLKFISDDYLLKNQDEETIAH